MNDAKVEVGNPVGNKVTIPNAPTPSQVARPLPEQEPAGEVKKKEEGIEKFPPLSSEVDTKSSSEKLDEKIDVDKEPKGTIRINIFENSPYTVDFDGIVTGSELDMAWRAMMKEYRVWKHIMFKKIEQEKLDGGG